MVTQKKERKEQRIASKLSHF